MSCICHAGSLLEAPCRRPSTLDPPSHSKLTLFSLIHHHTSATPGPPSLSVKRQMPRHNWNKDSYLHEGCPTDQNDCCLHQPDSIPSSVSGGEAVAGGDCEWESVVDGRQCGQW
eukprot:scaffold65336_cov58-Attheya_sp.AAC.1